MKTEYTVRVTLEGKEIVTIQGVKALNAKQAEMLVGRQFRALSRVLVRALDDA